jgi:tetratricopeptide (TPR) repeat protein
MTAIHLFRLPLVLAMLGAAITVAPGCKKGPVVEALSEDEANNPTALFQQGVRFLKTPDPKTGEVDYAQAYDHFIRSSEISPNARVSFNAGWTAEQMGNLDGAEKHYRKAFEMDPSYDRAMFSLINVLKSRDKHDEVASILKA